MSDLISCKI
jgi:serine/threonine protein kinase